MGTMQIFQTNTIQRLLSAIVLAVFIAVTVVIPVHAQAANEDESDIDPITRQALYENWPQYVPGDGAACGTAANGAPTAGGGGGANTPDMAAAAKGDITLTGGSNIEKAYNYFIARGLTPAQSAGIVGNLIAESGVDPAINQTGGGPGRGIAQWSAGDRWDKNPNGNVVAFAALYNPPAQPTDLVVQLDFIWYEMNSVAPWSQTLPAIRAETSARGAAVKFMQLYERPKDSAADGPNAKKRGDLAEAVLADPTGGTIGGATGDGAAAGGGQAAACTDAAGGGVGVGQITFPLITTKSAIVNNKPTPWCYQSQTNCHHDYNAADIMIAEGTQVIAAMPGNVVLTESIAGKNADVAIKGDDGNVYFYQHMAPGSLTVQDGQHVDAATPLGKVGNSAAAFGTATHLHFDMQPPPATNRPGCAGAACAAYNFLNVQPALISAYANLPE